jgi:hemolysin III
MANEGTALFVNQGEVHKDRSRDGSVHVTDEVYNSASSLVGFLLSILGSALLITKASVNGDAWAIVGVAIYSFTLMLLFAASTLHHLVNATEKIERAFRLFDYCAIFPLISGTMTPFIFICHRGDWYGWCIFGSLWLITIAGIALFLVFGPDKVPKWMSNTIFVTMGWMAGMVLMVDSSKFMRCAGLPVVVLIALGGVIYTAGGVVFLAEKPNPYPGTFGFHEIWHTAVCTAAVTHWVAVLLVLIRIGDKH